MTIDLKIKKPGSRIRLWFYGTRGSLPVPHPDFLQFGGNTTCIALQVEATPERISVVDAGTGIRRLGRDLMARSDYKSIERITVAFTHFHWDHIQGFPFFDPAYDPSIQMRIMAMGAGREFKDLRQIFTDQMQERYFPVKLEDMGADMEFMYPDSDVQVIREAQVSVIEQNHPGGSWGYRIEYEKRVLVVCTDIEHGDELDPNIVEFARGADVLVHEAQYTQEELEQHRGWGHSSYDQAIEVAKRAEVGFLIMTHHDPDHDDAFLFAREQECQAIFPNCVLAREGMEIII